MTVVKAAEKLPVLIQDMNTMVLRVCYQGLALVVCSNINWLKWFLGCWITRVSKSEFPGQVDHQYWLGCIVRYTYIQVPVLSDKYNVVQTRRKERITFIIELYTLFLGEVRVTHNFCLFIIITGYGNQEVPRKSGTNTIRVSTPVDQSLSLSLYPSLCSPFLLCL